MYKKDTKTHFGRAQRFKAINDALRAERVALRTAYHDRRRDIWRELGTDYQAKKDTA